MCIRQSHTSFDSSGKRHFLAAAVALSVLICADRGTAGDEPSRIKFSGNINYSLVQIVNSTDEAYLDAPWPFLKGGWLGSMSGGLFATVNITEKLKINTGLGGRIYGPVATELFRANWVGRQESAWIQRGAVAAIIGSLERPYLDITAGFFGYNTAPQSRNFGGFLYQPSLHPGYIFSNAQTASLAGFRFHSTYLPVVEHDLLVTFELYNPLFDISIGYVPGLALGDFLDISAGVLFHRIIPSSPEATRPEKYAYVEDGETKYVPLSGVKLMGRFCFDPKKLFSAGIFGEEDLKLYAEAAIIGVKNYPSIKIDNPETGETFEVGYNDITERIPVMAGLNIPAFKLLDYLAVEIEYYRFPYENDAYIGRGQPVPAPPGNPDFDPAQDDLRWAVMARRTLFGHFTVGAKFASDHFRTQNEFGWQTPEERLIATDEWYWELSLGGHF
jgi:hypothetical protein